MEREQLKQRLLGSSRSAHLRPHHICDDRSRFLLLLTWVPHSLGLCELTFSYLVGLYQTVCFFFFYPHTHTHSYRKEKERERERPDACHGSIPVTLFFLPFFSYIFQCVFFFYLDCWLPHFLPSALFPLFTFSRLHQPLTNTHTDTLVGRDQQDEIHTHTDRQTERRRFYSPISSFYG
jgi:hypothetical protein